MNKTLVLNLGFAIYLFFTFIRSLRYIHMFQLNSYMPDRLWRWFKRSYRDEYKLISLLHLFLYPLIVFRKNYIFLGLSSILFIGALYKHLTRKEKKKLVYTFRVKRLLATQLVLMAVFLLPGWIFATKGQMIFAGAVLAIYVILGESKIFYPVAANTVNLPVEKLIQRNFYMDAKRILGQNKDLIVIGITGSYGKTSSKFILSRILSEKFNVLMTPESYNTTMGVVRTIREKLRPVHEVFVVEMGAKNKGDIKEICDLVNPRYGLITSIGPQHLETFKNIETVIDTKFELVDALPPEGKAFLNYSNEYIYNKKVEKQVVSYALNKTRGVNCWAENIVVGSRGTTFDLCTDKGDRIKLNTQLLGTHNVLNILGACSIALELGVSPERIARGVGKIPPVPHRLEIKRVTPDYILIDDAYNANPEGAREAFSVLKNFHGYNKILVTPGLIELGELEDKLNYELGSFAADVFDRIILVGKKQTESIFNGIKDSGYDMNNVYVADNLKDALSKLHELDLEPRVVLFENDLPDDYEKY